MREFNARRDVRAPAGSHAGRKQSESTHGLRGGRQGFRWQRFFFLHQDKRHWTVCPLPYPSFHSSSSSPLTPAISDTLSLAFHNFPLAPHVSHAPFLLQTHSSALNNWELPVLRSSINPCSQMTQLSPSDLRERRPFITSLDPISCMGLRMVTQTHVSVSGAALALKGERIYRPLASYSSLTPTVDRQHANQRKGETVQPL